MQTELKNIESEGSQQASRSIKGIYSLTWKVLEQPFVERPCQLSMCAQHWRFTCIVTCVPAWQVCKSVCD